MRALLCRQYGEPDTLTVEDIPSPVPGQGELLVDVKAAAVNFPDVLMIQNKYQYRPQLPFSPGYEIAGTVREVGAGVTGIAVGDAGVAMIKSGGFAQQAVVPAEWFWRLPAAFDFKIAAAFPLAYGTSYHALKDRAHLGPGETLVVLGAAGGVGLAAVQIGKAMGARVIACASSDEKLALCRRHGADELINYRTENLREAIRTLTADTGADVVLDPVGGQYAEPCVRGMAWNGRYLVVGFTGGEISRLPLNLPLLKGCSIVGVAWNTYARRNPAGGQTNIDEMIAWIIAGKLRPVVTAEYTLDNAARALADVMQRRVQGKVIIVP